MKRKALVSLVWTAGCLAFFIGVLVVLFGDQVYTGNEVTRRVSFGETFIIDQPAKAQIIPERFRIRELTTGAILENKPSEFQALPAGTYLVEDGHVDLRLAAEGISMKVMPSTGWRIVSFIILFSILLLWSAGMMLLWMKKVW